MLFINFAEILEKIEPITERTKIRILLKTLYQKLDSKEIKLATYLLNSRIFHAYEGIELNVGQSIIEDAIAKAYGFNKNEITNKHMNLGDLGETAYFFAENKKQNSLFKEKLTIKKVYDTLRNIALEEGKNSTNHKIQKISFLLNSASPIEAKYIIKIMANNLRNNIGNQTIIETLVLISLEKENIFEYKENMELFNKYKSIIEEKYAICDDLGLIAEKIILNEISALEKIKINIGLPIKSALAEREANVNAILKRLGFCLVEAKYDGFRLQIHHSKENTKIFSRRGENLTHMFPEIKELLKKIDFDFIIDSEAIAFNPDTKEFLNFQETIKRKRKYNIAEKSKQLPIMIEAFDILYYKDKETYKLPLKERRKILEKLIKEIDSDNFKTTEAIYAEKEKEIKTFFNHCLKENLEGIIAKDLNKPYMLGKRDFAWIKLKKNYLKGEYDSVDLVIIGYFLGNGKYANKPSSLLCAIYDKDTNSFKAVAKVASGLSEKDVDFFDEKLKEIKLKSKPKNYITELNPNSYVEPKYMIEIIYDEISKSNSDVGYSLRFPRFVKIRDDKDVFDTTTQEELKRLYNFKVNVK